MNYHKGFIAPILLALIALLLAGGAYVYVQTKQTKESDGARNSYYRATSTRNEFSVSPSSGSAPLSAVFSFVTSDTIDSRDSLYTYYLVNFGDNSTEYNPMKETRCTSECRKFTVTHIYKTPDTYVANLTRQTDSSGPSLHYGEYLGSTTITVTSK